MEPNNKKPKDHKAECLFAAFMTAAAGILVIFEREILQSMQLGKIVISVFCMMFWLFLCGASGYASVEAFYRFKPNAKKGEENEEQPRSIVERILFWLVFLSVAGWLMLKFAGAI